MKEENRTIDPEAIDNLDDTMRTLQGVAGVLCDMSVANESIGGHVWDHRSLMMLSDVVSEQVSALSEVRKMVLGAPETVSQAS